MNLAVSNIAWEVESDEAIAEVLRARQVSRIEVAPSKAFEQVSAATEAEARDYQKRWAAAGFDIVACQSLLFGRPDLTVFDGDGTSAATEQYLARVVQLCSALGAGPLVFGSPKHRRRNGRSEEQASSLAAELFRRLGEVAVLGGSCLCVEANPPRYGADFLTTATDAASFVRRVGHPGVRLHLDTACMALVGDDMDAVIDQNVDILAHVHISEPDLGPVMENSALVDHGRMASALRRAGYVKNLSIEMRPTDDPAADVAAAVDFATETYLG